MNTYLKLIWDINQWKFAHINEGCSRYFSINFLPLSHHGHLLCIYQDIPHYASPNPCFRFSSQSNAVFERFGLHSWNLCFRNMRVPATIKHKHTLNPNSHASRIFLHDGLKSKLLWGRPFRNNTKCQSAFELQLLIMHLCREPSLNCQCFEGNNF
jgi:hypothetical protein